TRAPGRSRKRCCARRRLREARRSMPRRGPTKGKVSLVGAGPGDPGLLTLGALLRLREADVVIYDRLVSEEVLSLIPEGIPRVYGGKGSGSKGGERQDELNDLMLREARSGKKVV